jgi:hypothetical protein
MAEYLDALFARYPKAKILVVQKGTIRGGCSQLPTIENGAIHHRSGSDAHSFTRRSLGKHDLHAGSVITGRELKYFGEKLTAQVAKRPWTACRGVQLHALRPIVKVNTH